MADNKGSEDSQTARQPSRAQFGKGLAEDIRERGDRRNITFDALRGKLVIDGGESIDIRLYVTCMCLYMLEVYYRQLPIYQESGEDASK